MFVKEELKLNRFRKVMIPSNASFVSRFSPASMPLQQYSGEDNLSEPVLNKAEQIARDQELYDKLMQDEADSNS